MPKDNTSLLASGWTWVKSIFNRNENPEHPAHGANWTGEIGVKEYFPAILSLFQMSKHGYTFACIMRSSEDLGMLPIILKEKKGDKMEVIHDHEVLDLFKKPTTFTKQFLFITQLAVDVEGTGNGYVLVVGGYRTTEGKVQKPSSLFRLHPENCKPVPDESGIPQYYEYTEDGEVVQYPAERIIHIRRASWRTGAEGELLGTGVVEPLSNQIEGDIKNQRLVNKIAGQGRPDLIVYPKKDGVIWGKERRETITQKLKKLMVRGGALVLDSEMGFEPFKASPKELEFSNLHEMTIEDISAVTGVPPSVMGKPDANYATSRQASKTYWTNQQPKGRRIEEMLTEIAQMFNPNFSVCLDYSGIEALQEQRTEQLKRADMKIDHGMNPKDAYESEGLDGSYFEGTVQDQGEEEDESKSKEDKELDKILDKMFSGLKRKTKETQDS